MMTSAPLGRRTRSPSEAEVQPLAKQTGPERSRGQFVKGEGQDAMW
jgi:hypothetical protein